MTIPVFANNVATELTAALGSGVADTTISVLDASVFSDLLVDPVGDDYRRHQVATLDDGTNFEIVHIIQIDTAGNTITVTRGEEDTTKLAFAIGDKIEHRLTAGVLNAGWFGYEGHDWWYERHIGDYSVSLISYADYPENTAGGNYSVAIGPTPEATSLYSLSIGYDSYVKSGATSGLALGHNARVLVDSIEAVAVGSGTYAQAAWTTCLGAWSYAGMEYGVSAGAYANAEGEYDICIGAYANTEATAFTGAIAIGQSAWVRTNAEKAIAIGVDAYVTAPFAIALGEDMDVRVPYTHSISGLSTVVQDRGQTDEVHYFVGQENIICSEVVVLTSIAADLVEITMPTGGTFYPNEVGLIIDTATAVTVQPTVSFGITGSSAFLLAATATTKDTSKDRERYETLLSDDGVTSLTMSVTVAGVATTLNARAYFKGIFIEDE